MAVQKGITLEELHALLKEPESASLECKEAKGGHYPVSRLGEYCSAIANAGGGHMLFGVNDKVPHEVVGTSTYSSDQIPDIEAKLAGNLSPAIRIEISEHMLDDRRVVAVKIPSRANRQVVRYGRVPYMKTGNQMREMTDQELVRILTENNTHWLDETCVSGRNGAEVMDLLDVKGFYEMIGKPMPPDHNLVMKHLSSEGILSPTHAKNKFSISRMGVLLLANSVEKCSPDMAAKRFEIIKFKTDAKSDPIVFRYCCDKGYAIGFNDMLNTAMTHMEVREGGVQGETVEIAPRLAVRELLANAIIHQDFEINDRVVLRIFRNSAELINPGDSLVDLDAMMQNSASRNVRLLDLMRKFKLAEHVTSGIEKIIAAVEQSKSAPPKFDFRDRYTHVAISRGAEYDQMSWAEIKIAGYQHCLLKHARKSAMTKASLRERFNLANGAGAEISQLLKELVREKKIKRSEKMPGSRRHASYVPYWA